MVTRLTKSLRDNNHRHPIVGTSFEAKQLNRSIKRLAKTDDHVLLIGDVGTGKTFCAERIHALSARREQPFVKLNCAALGNTICRNDFLGESGPRHSSVSLLEQAKRGVLFLENIADLVPDFQSMIKAIIADRKYMPVGASKARAAEFRIIAATAEDPANGQSQDALQKDLVPLLAQRTVRLPALRDRRQDIPELLLFFLKKYCERNRIEIPAVPAEIFEYVLSYDWKGNVRELKDCVETLVMMSPPGELCLDYLPFEVQRHPLDCLDISDLNRATSEVEIYLIRKALEKFAGNQVKAARQLGIPEATLRFKIKKYAIAKEV